MTRIKVILAASTGLALLFCGGCAPPVDAPDDAQPAPDAAVTPETEAAPDEAAALPGEPELKGAEEMPEVAGERYWGNPGTAPVVYETPDGASIRGDHYPTANEPEAAALLVPMLGHSRMTWQLFANELQLKNITSVAIDLRGHGDSTAPGEAAYTAFSDEQWQAATADIAGGIEALRELQGDDIPIVLVGASIGANLAAVYAGEHPDEVDGLVLLSPGLDYHGVQPEAALRELENTPVFIAAAQGDEGSYAGAETLAAALPADQVTTEFIEGDAHGTAMLKELQEPLLEWMAMRGE